MKKIIFCVLFFALSADVLGQQLASSVTISRDDLLAKSKKQKRTGRVLLISGAALTITGGIIIVSEFGHILDYQHKDNSSTAAVFIISGVSLMGASIPFYAAASRNKKRAANLSLRYQGYPQLQSGLITHKLSCAAVFKMSL